MQFHELKPTIKIRGKKRVGRGGKRGTFSGRGEKGQKSRAGHRIRPAWRDTLQRIPKLKGIKNPSIKKKPKTLRLSDLNAIAAEIITAEVLKSGGLLPKNFKGEVKILDGGELNHPKTLKGIKVSKSVKIKIEKAGGKILD